jgi:two-component system, OmpR family, sensor histidine kinase BaeS
MQRISSIPFKSVFVCGAVMIPLLTAEWLAICHFLPAPDAPLKVAMVLGCGMVVGFIASAWWSFHLVRHRSARLARVLEAIRGGNLKSELEPLLDCDLNVVRQSLIGMREALDEMTTRLRHVDSQRRRLFADLAHELATPVSTIMASAEALADPALCRSDADRARVSACLDQEATRLTRLIADIRDLARLDDPDVALALKTVELDEIVRSAVEGLNRADPKRRPIRFTATPAPAIADAGRIDQVLLNLLTNAKRYTPSEGEIQVDVGPGARIVIEDSGVGVPDDVLPRLGERLLRVDPSRATNTGGSGLGLSIVAAIVHRHGGTLRFERATLGGLRAVVELPRAEAITIPPC